MNWFEGEIAQAVAKSKSAQAVFVVYVYGKDEKSVQLTELINTEEISNVLGGDKFVAIKIEADSVPHQQFTQIYKVTSIPSIYFIGKQGGPLEIITEAPATPHKLLEKFQQILEKGGYSESTSFIEREAQPQAPPDVVCENGVCPIKPEPTPSTSQTPETPETPDLSAEDKVERAKQLVEIKREEKKREEDATEKQKEIERRKMGQSAQQLQRWQEEQEMKQVLEERQREKREGQAARDRVLAQIAQDRAERASKASPPSPTPVAAAPATTPKASSVDRARIQFKLPDGGTSTSDFSSQDPLQAIHNHIKAELHLPFTHYTLATTFPRREFTENDASQSLADLGLVPTAVILILPLNRGAISTNSEGGLLDMFWSLLAPVFTILNYLKGFVIGGGGAPGGAAAAGGSGNKRSSDVGPRGQAKVLRSGESTVRKQGNVHRLSNKSDSDEDNNTWNGNSTQQM